MTMWYRGCEADAFRRAAAAELAGLREAAALVQYLELLDRGLRKPALAALRMFLAEAEAHPLDTSAAVADALMRTTLRLSMSPSHAMGPLLMDAFVLPTLERWGKERPEDARPQLWLGTVTGSVQRLERALALDPADERAVHRLCAMLLGQADFGVHHLPWGYCGDVEEDLAALHRVEELLPQIGDFARWEAYRRSLESLRPVVESYAEYKSVERDETFEEWAIEHGKPMRRRSLPPAL